MDGLPRAIDETTLKIAPSYINRDNAIAFIYEINSSALGCLAGKIQQRSFPPSGVRQVGNITICLVSALETSASLASWFALPDQWFFKNGVNVV